MNDEILTKNEMKNMAIEYMIKLKIYTPYISAFKNRGWKTMFENYGGFWTNQYKELEDRIMQFEKETGHLVYAITHEYTEFGELYDFICVSKYKEDKDTNLNLHTIDNTIEVFAWVWNKTDTDCSEYGCIGVHSFGGGIKRIW